MPTPQDTSWTLIEAAASGDQGARASFTRRYLPVVRGYMGARWSGSALMREIDDAVQEVFLDCFRQGGVLERADPLKGHGFRCFLHGVVRNVALHFETRRARDWERQEANAFLEETLPAREASLSKVFDQEWARSVMREAAQLQAAKARSKGPDALRRVEILHLRFHEGLAIRDIARLWNLDPDRVHHDYAQARKEFTGALREIVGLDELCTPERLEEECGRIIELLQ